MNRSRLLLVVIAAPLVLGACRKKQPAVVPPTPTSEGTTTPTSTPPRENTNTGGNTTDPGAAERERTRIARERMLATIYFEYDADAIRDDARQTLDAKIPVMNANPGLRIRVIGHTDERGSDEYNIALGRRRAEAAKRYLVDRGIDASRIETTTFGRERPAVQGSGEEAWSRNRRDEFEITAGGDNLRAPAT